MYVVYWMSNASSDASRAEHRKFGPAALAEALRFTEELRKRQAGGEDIGFVTLCSENPHLVGKPGAADPSADYDWKKRRR